MKPIIAAILMMRSPDIPALVERVSSLHRWIAIAYIGSLLLAALFSYLLWSSGNKVQDALRAESDARIADAEARIAQVKAQGETAKSEADEKIAKSGEKIAELNRQSEEHKAEAESARRGIAVAQAEAAKANERAALANEKAETLKAESFALQRIIRPRRLYNNPDWVDPLKQFQGMQAVISVFPDSEAQVFAGSITSVLNQAGWMPEIRVSASVPEGLAIWSGTWPEEGSPPDRAWMAGEALAEMIGKEFAVTETGPRMSITHGSEDIRPLDWKAFSRPPGVVLIEVGMLPMYESLMLLKHMKGVYEEGPPPKRPKFKPKSP
jgi:hypothetical protein